VTLSRAASASVDTVVRQALIDADAVSATNLAASQRLSALLKQADRSLGLRMRAWNRANGGDSVAFTPNGLVSYRRQIQLAIAEARVGVTGQLSLASDAARNAALANTVSELRALDRAFTGIVRPLRIPQAMRFDHALHGDRSSLLRQHATSMDRYGAAMVAEFEKRMAVGFLGGMSQGEIVNELTGMRGPAGEVSIRARVEAGRVIRTQTEHVAEGLFTRYRSWPWRIVRTETAYAYNAAKLDTLSQLRRSGLRQMKKKIVAHFDRRTAQDSIAVHGQIRDVDGPDSYFVDGDARVYQHPPARPNDRECVIPWLAEWGEGESTRPLSPAEVTRADAASGTGRQVPAPGTTGPDLRAAQTAARLQRRIERLTGPPTQSTTPATTRSAAPANRRPTAR